MYVNYIFSYEQKQTRREYAILRIEKTRRIIILFDTVTKRLSSEKLTVEYYIKKISDDIRN